MEDCKMNTCAYSYTEECWHQPSKTHHVYTDTVLVIVHFKHTAMSLIILKGRRGGAYVYLLLTVIGRETFNQACFLKIDIVQVLVQLFLFMCYLFQWN